MYISLPKRRVDYVLIVANLFGALTAITSLAYFIYVMIELHISTHLQLIDYRLYSYLLIGNIFTGVGSLLSMISSFFGAWVSYKKHYLWYHHVVSNALFCVIPLVIALSYSADANYHISRVYTDVSTEFHRQLNNSRLARYTGDMRSTDSWSIYWDYFQYENGCCGLDSAEDYIHTPGEYYDDIAHMSVSGNKYSIYRKLPRSCCYYKDSYRQKPKHLDSWLKDFISAPAGRRCTGTPYSDSEEFNYCINETLNTPVHVSEEACYPKLRSHLVRLINTITVMQLVPLLTVGFCKLMSLWYLYNQTYGLPSDMNLYIANINAGLHRKSDPVSVVLAVNYPIPTQTKLDVTAIDMLHSHLINEKPGDTQVTKMLTSAKKTKVQGEGSRKSRGEVREAGPSARRRKQQ